VHDFGRPFVDGCIRRLIGNCFNFRWRVEDGVFHLLISGCLILRQLEDGICCLICNGVASWRLDGDNLDLYRFVDEFPGFCRRVLDDFRRFIGEDLMFDRFSNLSKTKMKKSSTNRQMASTNRRTGAGQSHNNHGPNGTDQDRRQLRKSPLSGRTVRQPPTSK
jgi:hypothetical protein